MTTTRGRFFRSLGSVAFLSALLLALVPAMAGAQDNAREGTARDANRSDNEGIRVSELRIGLQDMKTKADLGYVQPGEVLELNVGDRVRLRMIAVVGGQWRAPRYPSAAFAVLAGSDKVHISQVDRDQGSAVIEAARPTGGKDALVSYELLDSMDIRPGLVKGTITVRIGDGGGVATSAPAAPAAAPDASSSRASETVTALYRGILLREPDAAGAQPRIDRIEREGLPAVLSSALEIAQSSESRVDLSSRGVTPEQRLEALYQNFLGQTRSQIDPAAWDADLQRLRQGKIDEVVRRLIASPQFRVQHQWNTRLR
ncbi:MAG: hypothetical protein KDD11_02535 [Acidobacteria bacterium]|nr:hypothetical protein [Acidobacteriota bacterium]